MPWPTKGKIKVKPSAPPKQILASVKTSNMGSGAPADEPWARQPLQDSPYTTSAHLRAAAAKNQ